MKKIFFFCLPIIFLLPPMASAQTDKIKKEVAGIWLFDAPYAPEGYKAGKIEVAIIGKEYSATMSFSGGQDKYAGDKVKFENDTLFFNVFIQDQDVAVKIAMIEESKMAGKAVYSEGIVPLTLTREGKKEN